MAEKYKKLEQKIAKLEEENKLHIENIERLNEKLRIKCDEIAELKKQIPVWHNISKCINFDENGNALYNLPVEDDADINGDVYVMYKTGDRGTEQWDEIDVEITEMWCELPTAPTENKED